MLGNKNQSIIPVAFSLMASFMSAITLFGLSAENYYHGTQFVVINLSYVLGTPIITHIFLPVFFNLGNLSVYEVSTDEFHSNFKLLLLNYFYLKFTFFIFIVLGETIWPFNKSLDICGIQHTNDTLHGNSFICSINSS